MTELFPRGKAEILGIYGPSASANPPQQQWSCNINQIPSMFFDYRCMTSGQLTFGIFIDGKDTGDTGGTHMENTGDVRPFHFWVPQKVRTPGIHQVVVKYGHVERKPEQIVWDGKAEFSLELTGIKQE